MTDPGFGLLQPEFGRRVRHADGTLFAEAGERVALTPFYRRLIADGDLVAVTPSKLASSRTSKSRPAKKGPSS